MRRLSWSYLATVPYQKALQIQYAHAHRVSQGAEPVLFLLEHPPTVTLGRQADESNLKMDAGQYADKGMEIARTQRGGDVTFHGPGQLIGYPVACLDDFQCSVRDWVYGCAQALVAYLAELGISARWSQTHPGVWVSGQKLAALGFHIARRVSTHGFALYLNHDLSYFDTIVPCGLHDRKVGSVADLRDRAPSPREAAPAVAGHLAASFGWKLGEELDAGKFLEENLNESSHAAVV